MQVCAVPQLHAALIRGSEVTTKGTIRILCPLNSQGCQESIVKGPGQLVMSDILWWPSATSI